MPREHGAWAMLCLPLLLGMIVAGTINVSVVLILPGALLLFLGRFAAIGGGTRVRLAGARSLLDVHRLFWVAVYFGGSAAFLLAGVMLAAPEQRADAMTIAFVAGVLGLANAILVLTGRGRNIGAESVAMAATAAMGPLLMVLAGRPLSGPTVAVGVLCLAYFLSSLVFIRTHRVLKDAALRARAVVLCVAGHGLLGAALVAMSWLDWIQPAMLLAFVPPLVRTTTGILWPASNLRVLGWREMGVAISFLVVASIIGRVG